MKREKNDNSNNSEPKRDEEMGGERDRKKKNAYKTGTKGIRTEEQINIKQRIIGIAFYVREIFQLAQIHSVHAQHI